MPTRESIIREIQRIAERSGGRSPGWRLFQKETGLSEHAWKGKYWSKWGDALREAGFAGNELNLPYSDEEQFLAYISVARSLHHLPTEAEYKLARRQYPDWPSPTTFRRFGSKDSFIEKLAAFAKTRGDLEDIADYCAAYRPRLMRTEDDTRSFVDELEGFVYLIRSGRFYKVGRSNAIGRREREIVLQLPEAAKTLHVIRTDDPVGIEAYWHRRFAEKRKNGEWFELSAQDIAAFKRRKFM